MLSPLAAIGGRKTLERRHLLALPTLPFALWLVPVLVLACVIRLYRLDASDLWLDETISYFIANRPLLGIISYTAASIAEHPPGYYILLHLWMAVAGTTAFSLRYLSFAGGVLSVACLATLARRWFGPWIAWLAALLLAVQPLATSASREARMYAWLVAATVLAVYAFDRAIASNRWRDWLSFAVATGVAVSLNYLSGLILPACVLYYALNWRRLAGRRSRFVLTLAALLGLPFLWVIVSPGPRGSLFAVLSAMREPWQPERFLPVYVGWPLGNAADEIEPAQAFMLASIRWALVLLGLIFMPMPRSRQWQRGDLRLWLALAIIVPPLAGTFVFVLSKARYYAGFLGFFALGLSLGLAVLIRHLKIVGVIGLAALLAVDGSGDYRGMRSSYRPFSVPMQYLESRARDGEPVVFTDPRDQFLRLYYAQRDLPARYVPGGTTAPTDAEADGAARDVVEHASSSWLMLLPSTLDPERVEKAFNKVAFPAEKVWFDGGRGLVHYYSPVPMQDRPGGMVWDQGIHLNRWQVSGSTIAAGDAMRLEFEWQRAEPIDRRVLVALTLVGPDGTVWAKRVAEPCNNRCLTTEWPEGPVTDRHALYVPPDVPPGDYSVRIAWLAPDGTPLQGHDTDNTLPRIELPLLDLHVDSPAAPIPASPSLARTVNANIKEGLTLRSVQFSDQTLRGGAAVGVPLQWQVSQPQPPLEAHLLLERAGQTTVVPQALGPAWYPPETWSPGRIVRTQPLFTVPGTLAPGAYHASVVLAGPTGEFAPRVALGTITIADRPRQFDMPAIGSAMDVEWAEGVRLARLAVAGQAAAGDRVPVTLVWQAGGPTSHNWKVFIHLVDASGNVVAQHDAYPAAGTALGPTWQAGEVIADVHPLGLPAELPAGTYYLQVGFYDEQTNERLARTEGGDTLVLPAPLQVNGR